MLTVFLQSAVVRIGGLALLERQFGILGTVEGLELDVARLRITLDDLRLAARGSAREPFLRAAEARVDAPWSESARDVALRDLRVGTGFGLRLDSPFGLLRADYGFPLHRQDDGPPGRLFISLGQAF